MKKIGLITAASLLALSSPSFAGSFSCDMEGLSSVKSSSSSAAIQKLSSDLGQTASVQKSVLAQIVVSNPLDMASSGMEIIDTVQGFGREGIKSILQFGDGVIKNAVELNPKGISTVTLASGYDVIHLVLDTTGDLTRIAVIGTSNLVDNSLGSVSRWLKKEHEVWHGIAGALDATGFVINGVMQLSAGGIHLVAHGVSEVTCLLGQGLGVLSGLVFEDIPEFVFLEIPTAIWEGMKDVGAWLEKNHTPPKNFPPVRQDR